MRKWIYNFQILMLFIFRLSPASIVFAKEDGKIQIEQIEPGVVSGYLTVDAIINNLFSPKIVGTIQSGLPSIFEYEVKLLQENEKSRFYKFIRKSVAYDIWEESYTIRSPDTSIVLKNFDLVKKEITHLQKLKLIKISSLSPDIRYILKIRVRVIPISTVQGDKIVDWLKDPNQTEEELPSENRSSGFKLNLSKLVSFFIGSNKSHRNSSEWFTSKPFNLEILKSNLTQE